MTQSKNRLLISVAMEAYGARRYFDTESLCKKALTINPEDPDALHLLGLVQYKLGRRNVWVENLRKAVQLCPENEEIRRNLSNLIREKAAQYFPAKELPWASQVVIYRATCNYRCLFCPQSDTKPDEQGALSTDLIIKFLKELPSTIKVLDVAVYGETFIATNFFQVLELIKENRPEISVTINTNGSLLTEKRIRDVYDSGVGTFLISLGAVDRERYRQLMQIDNYDKVVKIIEEAIRIKREMNAKTTLGIHLLALKEQDDLLNEARDNWLAKGLDFVDVRDLQTWPLRLSVTENLAKAGFTPLNTLPTKRYPCSAIFFDMTLRHDGMYSPCCATSHLSADIHRPYDLGHAKQVTWSEAWEKLGEMRQAHLRGEWNKYEVCRDCTNWSFTDDIWEDRDEQGAPRFKLPFFLK
jgi:MoaA/NifB/PqqE/SkfB family radical SAM enzyme